MTTTISFADWVDWLAIELTFVELYESAPPTLTHEMAATVRRLAKGISEEEVAAFTAQVPSFERALGSFSLEAQSCFADQFAAAVIEFSGHVARTLAHRD